MTLHHHAFISYSHTADARLAPLFEKGLEHLARPLLKLRALDIFRDETSLAASPALWPGIQAHLEASDWFLFFASPNAATSQWCQKEVEWWLEHRAIDRLLIVLTDGEIFWDARAGDFDWQRTSALPACMAGRLADEPLYVDLRWARESRSLTLEHARFREAVVSIAAPLRGMPRDELDSADVRQLARNRLFVRAGVAAICVAAVVAVWQAWVATEQAHVAEAQRQRAELALAESERELLRAQAAELRGLALRLDSLIVRARDGGDQGELPGLEAERQGVAERLARITRLHQAKLAEQIGFRGDVDFLTKWEGNAGRVKLDGDSVYIDPMTELASTSAEEIRSRYEFVLTPRELQALLATAGKRGSEATAAFAANPVLQRIRIAPADVARLVPEAIGPWWKRLTAQYPILSRPETPGAVQTALLSLGFNIGFGAKFRQLTPLIVGQKWAELADAIEGLQITVGNPQIRAAIQRRRSAEAGLIRAALASATSLPASQAIPPGAKSTR